MELNRNQVRRAVDEKVAAGIPWQQALQMVLDPDPKPVPEDDRLIA
jgi:hypothetical protein